MAREVLDHTGNESPSTLIARINAMFQELYAAGAEFIAWVGTTVTASGLIQGGTVTSTGLLTAGSAKLDTGTKTAAASAGAATLAKSAGVITSEALTTAAAAAYTLTLTNSTIAAADQVLASLQNGTNTAGIPVIERVTPGAGSVVIVVRNLHSADAFDGTIKIAFAVLKN